MLRNFVVTAFRHPLYSAINIFGLPWALPEPSATNR
jgi:hypothetical protein